MLAWLLDVWRADPMFERVKGLRVAAYAALGTTMMALRGDGWYYSDDDSDIIGLLQQTRDALHGDESSSILNDRCLYDAAIGGWDGKAASEFTPFLQR